MLLFEVKNEIGRNFIFADFLKENCFFLSGKVRILTDLTKKYWILKNVLINTHTCFNKCIENTQYRYISKVLKIEIVLMFKGLVLVCSNFQRDLIYNHVLFSKLSLSQTNSVKMTRKNSLLISALGKKKVAKFFFFLNVCHASDQTNKWDFRVKRFLDSQENLRLCNSLKTIIFVCFFEGRANLKNCDLTILLAIPLLYKW